MRNEEFEGVNIESMSSCERNASQLVSIYSLQQFLHVDSVLDARFKKKFEGVRGKFGARSDHDAVVTILRCLFTRPLHIMTAPSVAVEENFERCAVKSIVTGHDALQVTIGLVFEHLLHVDAVVYTGFDEELEAVERTLITGSEHDDVHIVNIALFEHHFHVRAVLKAGFDEELERVNRELTLNR